MIFLSLLLLQPIDTNSVAEPSPLLALPRCAQSVADSIDTFLKAAPRNYLEPTPLRLAALRGLASALVVEAVEEVLLHGQIAEYELCLANEAELEVLMRPSQADGQALAVWRGRASRAAFFEAPHPFFEAGTREQAEAAFFRLGGRLLLIAGAHRCASQRASSCSGATLVCGSLGPFRTSDAGHSVKHSFQVLHEAFAVLYPQAWAISFHGMSGRGIIVSDGTQHPVEPQGPVALLADALWNLYPHHSVATCNGYRDVETLLCGTTNVQGRFMNDSRRACWERAPQSHGRFLHLEQSRTIRRNSEPLYEALQRVLPQN